MGLGMGDIALVKHSIHDKKPGMTFLSCVVSGGILEKLYNLAGATEPT